MPAAAGEVAPALPSCLPSAAGEASEEPSMTPQPVPATAAQGVADALVSPDRLVVIPNGVHPACSPRPDEAADSEYKYRYIIMPMRI